MKSTTEGLEKLEEVRDLMETLREALDYVRSGGEADLSADIRELRTQVEQILNIEVREHGTFPSEATVEERVHASAMSDEDWRYAMLHLIEDLEHPFDPKNLYDYQFMQLMKLLVEQSEETVFDQILKAFRKTPDRAQKGIEDYFRRFPLWSTLDVKHGDTTSLQLRAQTLKQHVYDFLYFYQRFEDYISKYTLYGILINWFAFDFATPDKVKSMFTDYYEPDIFLKNTGDVFVDVGAFTGDSIQQYLSVYGGGYRRIYAYEISPKVVEDLTERMKSVRDVIVRPKGVGEYRTTMPFSEGSDPSANHLTEDTAGNDGVEVEVVPLDEDIQEPISFVKMDIEGAEKGAIRGMKGHIAQDHPKLAICTYHGYEDIWKIPSMIDDIAPGYHFYFRHYGGNLVPTEFVLLGKWEDQA